MSEVDFYEIVEALCTRPKMYTPTGTFNEVISWLEGYAIAANVGKYPTHSRFSPFRSWIDQRFEIKDPKIGYDKFREIFPTDEEALKNLPILYKEYIEHLLISEKT